MFNTYMAEATSLDKKYMHIDEKDKQRRGKGRGDEEEDRGFEREPAGAGELEGSGVEILKFNNGGDQQKEGSDLLCDAGYTHWVCDADANPEAETETKREEEEKEAPGPIFIFPLHDWAASPHPQVIPVMKVKTELKYKYSQAEKDGKLRHTPRIGKLRQTLHGAQARNPTDKGTYAWHSLQYGTRPEPGTSGLLACAKPA
ncbi:hypothetical protein BDP27DRAFT_1366769 [Rhodocollybia butyracea]|uniref:Uncharacterized protein n=1 Tax=Rhodocollybia butyracea TaxID=206335 RepID=A0A9P5U2S0_9AGAR|nr:hypothetical protein BDP27DRAFT_1366769 [Rhodocollybia butyracea]